MSARAIGVYFAPVAVDFHQRLPLAFHDKIFQNPRSAAVKDERLGFPYAVGVVRTRNKTVNLVVFKSVVVATAFAKIALTILGERSTRARLRVVLEQAFNAVL